MIVVQAAESEADRDVAQMSRRMSKAEAPPGPMRMQMGLRLAEDERELKRSREDGESRAYLVTSTWELACSTARR